ncbi:RnfABCDGE type electron transport complex subunit G [candidate division WOR-3 bacterium]|nr:RnfABCDGE type electron transport complex subunit G [candidate division WOR-3 bacterium]
MMRSRVWMVLSLVITCLISAFALSQVYSATAPVIYQRSIEEVKQALRQVMPAADSFPVAVEDSVWLALARGQGVGTVLRCARQGYGGPVPVIVGVDLQGRITGIQVAAGSLKETQGLGTKVTRPEWQAQFNGKNAAEAALRPDGGSIEAITGATISSRAVANGVRAAMEKYAEVIQP